MKIRVYNHKNKNHSLKLLSRKLIDFSVPILFPNMELNDDYLLRVFWRSSDEINYVYGCAQSTGDKEAEIFIDRSRPLDMQCMTHFHEMVHIKQMWKDNIIFEDDGVFVNEKLHRYEDYAKECLYPWEIEAYGYEYVLFSLFKEQYSLTKKDFKLPTDKFLRILEDDSRRAFLDGFGKGSIGG